MNNIKGITDIDEGTLRRIDWQELCPPVLFLRVFPLSLRFFQLCFVAFVLTLLGYLSLMLLGQGLPNQMGYSSCLSEFFNGKYWSCNATAPTLDVLFFLIVQWSCSCLPFCRCLLFALVSFPVAILTLAIARGFAVRLASTQQCSTLTSLGYAIRRFPSLLLALLIPAGGLVCLTLLLNFGFYIANICSFSGIIKEILTPLIYLVILMTVLIKVFFIVGFPLMIAAIAVDQSDGFDALARSVSYLTQRPLHFIFYVVLATIPGIIGFSLVLLLTNAFGITIDSFEPNTSNQGLWAQFWSSVCFSMPLVFLYIYTTGAMVAIYFMLRRSLDGTPYDVFKSALSNRPSRKLQPIVKDPQGAPIMADEVSSSELNATDNTASKEV